MAAKKKKKPRELIVAYTVIRGVKVDEYAYDDVELRARFPGGLQVAVRLAVDEKGPRIEVRNADGGPLLIEPLTANLVYARPVQR